MLSQITSVNPLLQILFDERPFLLCKCMHALMGDESLHHLNASDRHSRACACLFWRVCIFFLASVLLCA